MRTVDDWYGLMMLGKALLFGVASDMRPRRKSGQRQRERAVWMDDLQLECTHDVLYDTPAGARCVGCFNEWDTE